MKTPIQYNPALCFITLLTLLSFGTSARALDKPIDPCKAPQNTMEINECAKLELTKKDKELNAAYQALMQRLEPNGKFDDTDYINVKKSLVESQKNWMKYRDADCKAKYTLHEQGTIRGIVHLSCLKEKTEKRTKELLEWDKI